ncbi:MAG: hypothetical protein JSR46_02715 [Verrucomicrobia bacterium]|nr:hypothetical protein [Verrucomicrobiota bacterium]
MKRHFKKQRPPLPKFQRKLTITIDPQTGRYDPDKLFAFWKKSPLWELWQKEGIDKNNSSLISALNYPEYILRDFRRWWLAQTDAEFYIRVPWTDFDDWLKKNGFTGKVDHNYMKRFVNANEDDALPDCGRFQPQPRTGQVFAGNREHCDDGNGICSFQ